MVYLNGIGGRPYIGQAVTVNVTTCASILSVQSAELAQEIETEPGPALLEKANEKARCDPTPTANENVENCF